MSDELRSIDTTLVSTQASFEATVALNRPCLIIGKDQVIPNGTTVTVPATTDIVQFVNNAKFTGTGTLIINRMSASPAHPIFDSGLTVVFNDPQSCNFIHSKWWVDEMYIVCYGDFVNPYGIAVVNDWGTSQGEMVVSGGIRTFENDSGSTTIDEDFNSTNGNIILSNGAVYLGGTGEGDYKIFVDEDGMLCSSKKISGVWTNKTIINGVEP